MGHPMLPRPPSVPAAPRRVAGVVTLLAIAVVGLRARGRFSTAGSALLNSAAGHLATDVFAVAEGAGAVACVLLLVLVFRRPRRRRPAGEPQRVRWQPPVPWWMKTFALLLALAVLAGPLVLVIAGARRGHGQRSGVPAAPAPSLAPPTGAGHAGPGVVSAGWPGWLVIAGMAAALTAAAAIAVTARRGPGRVPEPAGRQHDDRSPLGAGLTAGAGALRAGGDTRQAIIACYAAMERALARAGSPPGPADTPAQVLARAGAAGLVRTGAATTLTNLFRRARYSPHPMT